MVKRKLASVNGMLPMARGGVKAKGCEEHRKGYCPSCFEKYGEVCAWHICGASRHSSLRMPTLA